MRRGFNYLGIVLICSSFILSASTTVGYIHNSLEQNLTYLYSLLPTFSPLSSGVFASATPYFLIAKHALFLFTSMAIFFCLTAIYVEIAKIKKTKKI